MGGGVEAAGAAAHRPRAASTSTKGHQQHYDDSGPVDITARVHQKVRDTHELCLSVDTVP